MMRSAPGVRDQAEVHVEVAQRESLAAQRVHVLRVLAKEHPVDAQARHADGADVGEEVQLLAHGDVGALDVGPLVALLGGGGGAFERDVVVADLGQHVVRDGLELGGAVLDREAVDGAELHLAGGQRRGEQFLEQALRLGGDRRADAVAADDADPDRLQRAEVGRGRGLPNLRHPIGLLRQDCAEALLGLGDAVDVRHAVPPVAVGPAGQRRPNPRAPCPAGSQTAGEFPQHRRRPADRSVLQDGARRNRAALRRHPQEGASGSRPRSRRNATGDGSRPRNSRTRASPSRVPPASRMPRR